MYDGSQPAPPCRLSRVGRTGGEGSPGYRPGKADPEVDCTTFGDTALTIVAGPLNYLGVNPEVRCGTQPSR